MDQSNDGGNGKHEMVQFFYIYIYKPLYKTQYPSPLLENKSDSDSKNWDVEKDVRRAVREFNRKKIRLGRIRGGASYFTKYSQIH